MKTGYDQHFKKVKRTAVSPAFASKRRTTNQQSVKKSSFPVMPLLSFIFIAGSGLVFLDSFDSIEQYLQKIEISVGVANAAEVKPAAGEAKVEGAVGASAEQQVVHVEGKKIDDADYLFKLADRKKELDKREEELNKMAAQIEKQKVEITTKLAQLEEVRQKISAKLEDRIKADDGKVEVLVQMYTNMKPAQAAKVFETLDEDLVIEILSRMKKKSAADILNLIKPEKAQVFAERYTGFRAPAGTTN
jgi:flagellar motility protein MotE (MotC chaperone)